MAAFCDSMAAIFDRTGSYKLGLLLLPSLPLIALALLSVATLSPRADAR